MVGTSNESVPEMAIVCDSPSGKHLHRCGEITISRSETFQGKAWVFHVDVTVYLYQICDEYGLHVGYISDLSDIAEI